jgi:H+-transporting ATPase
LLVAVVGTQTLATLIAVYGLFMAPLGWGWALFVWGYALVWFLVNDRVKLIAYWALDRIAAKSAPNARFEAAPESEVVPKPHAKPQAAAARLD